MFVSTASRCWAVSPSERARRCCRRAAGPWSGRSARRPLAQEARHLLAGGQLDHPRAREIAEGEVRARVVERDGGPAERAGGEVGQRVGDARVDAHRPVELRGRDGEVGVAALLEVVQPAEVGDPVAGQPRPAAQVAAGGGEQEQQVQRARAVVEARVPVVGGADHRVPEPVGGDRELDRHGRDVGRRRADLERLAPVAEHVVERRRPADARQEVMAQHPLVVLGDELARLREALCRRQRGGEAVDDAVVEADERQVGLRDHEVLVVARVGDDRPPLGLGVGALAARQVEPVHRGVAADRGRLAVAQVHQIGLVEPRRLGVLRPGAVHRVEVQRRRAALQQRGRVDRGAEHHRRLVEGQVVVDELAQVGEPGRDA